MNSRRTWRPWVHISLVVLVLVLIAVWVGWNWNGELKALWNWLHHTARNRESIRNQIQSLGPLAPASFIALQSLQVVLSPIPGEATGFIGGVLFGQWFGFSYSTLGLTLGSVAAFSLSRFFRQFTQSWLEGSSIYQKFEHIIEHQGIFICFLLFVLPGFPKDFLCYLLGLSRMPWQAFLVIVAIGRMPGTMLLSMQGANIYEGKLMEFLIVLGITVVVVGPAWYYRERIYGWMESHSLRE